MRHCDITAAALAVACIYISACLVAFSGSPARADYSNITDVPIQNSIHAQTILAGGTYTQTRAFTALSKSVSQSVHVQGTGTSPNYKVEMLVTVNGTDYAKPEVGGDLGTFTDANVHIVAVATPLSVGHKLKITELGGVNSITIEAWERSQ